MANILTEAEVKKALWKDDDFDTAEATRLSAVASSFIKTKTGYDFGDEETKEPLAVQCAILYIRQQFFGADGYNEKYDFTIGITGLLVDLQGIAADKVAE